MSRFAPTCERVIEREHRDITMEVSAPHAGAVLVSLANRVPQLLDAVDHDPTYFPKLVSAFEEVRHVRQIPKLFPLISMHPLLRQMSKEHQTSHWVAVLTLIIYHCDLDSKYSDLTETKLRDDKVKDIVHRKAATFAARKSQSKHRGYETLVSVAVCQRLRALAQERSGRVVFSMPRAASSSSDSSTTLFPVVPLEALGS